MDACVFSLLSLFVKKYRLMILSYLYIHSDQFDIQKAYDVIL